MTTPHHKQVILNQKGTYLRLLHDSEKGRSIL